MCTNGGFSLELIGQCPPGMIEKKFSSTLKMHLIYMHIWMQHNFRLNSNKRRKPKGMHCEAAGLIVVGAMDQSCALIDAYLSWT